MHALHHNPAREYVKSNWLPVLSPVIIGWIYMLKNIYKLCGWAIGCILASFTATWVQYIVMRDGHMITRAHRWVFPEYPYILPHTTAQRFLQLYLHSSMFWLSMCVQTCFILLLCIDLSTLQELMTDSQNWIPNTHIHTECPCQNEM